MHSVRDTILHTIHIIMYTPYTDVSDYTQTIMTITLRGDGEESLEIMIPITNDFIVEQDETFTISFNPVSDSGNIPFYMPTTATILIIDDDGRGSLID